MKFVVFAGMAAVCLGIGAGCSSERTAATESVPPTTNLGASQDRARAVIHSADLELQDLRAMRARTTDDSQREAIDRQAAAITMRRDQLQSDLSVAGGNEDTGRLHADTANLEHSLRGAATEMQAPEPQQPAPSPQQPAPSH